MTSFVNEFFRKHELELARGRVPDESDALGRAHNLEALTRTDEAEAALRGATLSTPEEQAIAKLVALRIRVRRAEAGQLPAASPDIEALATPNQPKAIAARAHYLLALVQFRLQRYDDAEASLIRALDQIGDAPLKLWIIDLFGQVLSAVGAFEEARRTFDRVIDEKRKLGDTLGIAITVAHVSQLELDLGIPEAAQRHVLRALEDTSLVPIIRLRLAAMYLRASLELDETEAAARATKVVEGLFEEGGDQHPFKGMAAIVLARAAFANGDADTATRWLVTAQRVFSTTEHLAAVEYWRAKFARTDEEVEAAITAAQRLFQRVGWVTEAEVDTALLVAWRASLRGDTAAELDALAEAEGRATLSNNPLWLRRVDAYLHAHHPDRYRESILQRYTGSAAEDLPDTVRVDASVIFADLVGFTPRSEEMSAEDVMHTVRCLFELSGPVLAKHRVQALSYRGDGLLAAARGDGHEERALAFACEFTRRAARITKLRQALGDSWGLDVRAGVAAGPVVLGVLGTLSKLEYVINGYTANFAARLQGSAQPNEVVCDVRVAGKRATTEQLTLKGIAQPVPVLRLRIDVAGGS
jgi:class 3 adenylate cyclase